MVQIATVFLNFLEYYMIGDFLAQSRLRGWQRSAADLPVLLQPLVKGSRNSHI